MHSVTLALPKVFDLQTDLQTTNYTDVEALDPRGPRPLSVENIPQLDRVPKYPRGVPWDQITWFSKKI